MENKTWKASSSEPVQNDCCERQISCVLLYSLNRQTTFEISTEVGLKCCFAFRAFYLHILVSAAAGNKSATRPPLPPAGVRRRMERNRQKPVGRDKGSLTEQQTEGIVTITIQIRGIYKTNQQNRTALSDRTAAVPSQAASEFPPRRRPPPAPTMRAHGMEYPALFGEVGVGSAHPAVPLSGFW